MSLVDDYLRYQDTYQKQYGPMTIVFMQVGSFYEAYSTKIKGYNLTEIADLCNVICTKKDKKKEDSPSMLGFPTVSLQKYLKILMDEGLTIVIIDQVTPAPNPKREVTGIFSSGTYIEECKNSDSNNIIGLYFEEESHNLLCIGMVCIDLTTGKTIVHQALSSDVDKKFAIDECNRFIVTNIPTEILVYKKSSGTDISLLECDKKKLYIMDILPDFMKISFQNTFLNKVYKHNDMLSTIEYLDMERMLYSVTALVLTMDYAYQHNNNILKNMSKPIILEDNTHMKLGNDDVFQLNIISNDSNKGKFKSVFDIVNKTCTAMGKRYLKSMLCAPILDEDHLNSSYDIVEDLIKDKFYEKIQVHLKAIMDIERYHRKISLNTLNPQEFYNLLSSYSEILSIFKLVNSKYDTPDIKVLEELISKCDVFNLEEMKKYHLNDIQECFFKPGAYPELDALQEEINHSMNFMEESAKLLSGLIDGKGEDKIKVKRNEKDGYFLSVTKLRAKAVSSNMKKITILDIVIMPSDIKIKELDKGNSKITFDAFDLHSDMILKNKDKIIAETKRLYLSFLESFYESKDFLEDLVNFVSYFDYFVSNAKVATEYNYCKPNIISTKDNKSCVDAIGLRHPLIEKIIEVEYIPHNICLGKCDSLDGMLIYGINSSGKSSLMKSVGISLIMAQCGMYVPANVFNYKPYKSLYARISSNDNLFRGLSSFAVELTEIDSILKRADSNTLVIGDEVCNSTETVSAHSLVAAVLITLSKLRSSFIFATHLHDISKIKYIQEITNIKSYHLSVAYNESTGKLVFDRILKEGQGDSVYGITVAKFFIKNNEFMKLTNDICNDLRDEENTLISVKKSRYNAKHLVDECFICQTKEDLNTHHINFQKDCKDGFVITKPHLPMNSVSNLVTLCRKCHHDVHTNNVDIKGYILTSHGKELTVA